MATGSVLPAQTILGVEEPEAQPSLAYRLDLKERRVLGMVDGVDAVRQAATLMLLTPRFKCLIFDNQYGSELCQVIEDPDMTEALARELIDRTVRETLVTDDRILDITGVSSRFEGENVYITVDMNTVFGPAEVGVWL